jgi:hypothetical protein
MKSPTHPKTAEVPFSSPRVRGFFGNIAITLFGVIVADLGRTK